MYEYFNIKKGVCQMKRKRNPKNPNLSALNVVDSNHAYNGKKMKKEVYGIVSKEHPFIYKNVVDRKTKKNKPKYVNDSIELPQVTKQKIIAFFDDSKNSKKTKCYLIDK